MDVEEYEALTPKDKQEVWDKLSLMSKVSLNVKRHKLPFSFMGLGLSLIIFSMGMETGTYDYLVVYMGSLGLVMLGFILLLMEKIVNLQNELVAWEENLENRELMN